MWSDLGAGLTVGAMLVPQAMAYALLAGLPPEVGLYASIVPLVVYAVLGTSRQLAVGPVAIVSLLSATTLASVADEGTAGYLAAAGMLAVLVGVTNGHAELEGNVGTHPEASSDVQAILSYFAATDLTTILAQSTPFGVGVRELHGHASILPAPAAARQTQ